MRRFTLVLVTFFIAGALLAGSAAAESLLRRGTYLVRGVAACGNCHSTRGKDGEFVPGGELAGGFLIETKPFTAFAPNITPHKATGIGKWTNAQIVTAIRDGKRPDGGLIGPPMPIELYRHLSDRDVMAIVAYLRSVKPVENKVPRSVYRIKLPPAYGPKVTRVPEPDRSDKLAYGAYLAGPAGHCVECHTPMNKGGRRDYANRFAAGGFVLDGPWGHAVSANITPDKKTGIGAWSDAHIKRAITKAVRADGGLLGPPMAFPFYATIKDQDLDAIVAYLRSLKPVRNRVR